MGEKNTKDEQTKEPVSLLDLMEEGKEYESLSKHTLPLENIQQDIQRAIADIKEVRKREVIAYIGNVVNQDVKGSRSIDFTDDLPFSEMIKALPSEVTEVDIILVTGGGSFTQVAKFVDILKARNFRKVTFIIPNIAMSAGTIFAMSGNEIIMGEHSYLGPIDPQVPNKDGVYIPAQSILTFLSDIQKRGQEALDRGGQPQWTDLQFIRNMDIRDIARANNSTQKISKMVEDYLVEFKFRDWKTHSDTNAPVTDDEKRATAKAISEKLCDHSTWKVHDIGITRDEAWSYLRLEIVWAEGIPGLEAALKRFWALLNFMFEKTYLLKIYCSSNYYVAKFGTK